jgi:hypothetical protein
MKTRTHFTHRIDMWDSYGDIIIEHLTGVEDYQVAAAKASSVPGRTQTAVLTSSGAANPRVPVLKLWVVFGRA